MGNQQESNKKKESNIEKTIGFANRKMNTLEIVSNRHKKTGNKHESATKKKTKTLEIISNRHNKKTKRWDINMNRTKKRIEH